jgi:hypothetical protein
LSSAKCICHSQPWRKPRPVMPRSAASSPAPRTGNRKPGPVAALDACFLDAVVPRPSCFYTWRVLPSVAGQDLRGSG